MEKKYDFTAIEKKWQKYWDEHNTFHAENGSDKPKYTTNTNKHIAQNETSSCTVSVAVQEEGDSKARSAKRECWQRRSTRYRTPLRPPVRKTN